MSAAELFAEWQRALDVENRELKDDGEEPLTIAEFVSCKAQDASFERVRVERLRVENWHRAYAAALTGTLAADNELDPAYVRRCCTEHADTAYGPLTPELKP